MQGKYLAHMLCSKLYLEGNRKILCIVPSDYYFRKNILSHLVKIAAVFDKLEVYDNKVYNREGAGYVMFRTPGLEVTMLKYHEVVVDDNVVEDVELLKQINNGRSVV